MEREGSVFLFGWILLLEGGGRRKVGFCFLKGRRGREGGEGDFS